MGSCAAPFSLVRNNPLFRFALPFMAGIVAGWHFSVPLLHLCFVAAFSLLGMLVGFFRFSPRWLFGVSAVSFMFFAGVLVEEKQENAKALQWEETVQHYSAVLLEEPDVRPSTVRVLADVSLMENADGAERSNGRVYLYFPRCVEAESLHLGSKVEFDAAILPFRNAGNPAEFDSELFYYIKGVTGTAFVSREGWTDKGQGDMTLRMRALELRASIVDMYRELPFGENESALLSALSVGEKEEFPKELREEYSAAGASHVLALSGLHLGIFYAILITLFPLWSRSKLLVIAREGVIVLLLWAFAFVAGLSPSVVRAAILFTLMSVGRCIGQESSSLSSLSFAAVAMLLFSPHLLFDVSFQLSFAAVFSIILFVQPLQRAFRTDRYGRLPRSLMNMIILSFAAQLGTMPLVWYYFGMFPLYFLLTNLVIVPLAFMAVSVTVVLWVLALLPALQYPVACVLDFILQTMNWCASAVASFPGASFSMPDIDAATAFFIAVVLMALVYALLQRKWWLSAISACGLLLSVAFIIVTEAPSNESGYVIVYNNRRNPLLHVVGTDGKNSLVSTVPELDAEYEYVSAPYIKREGLEEPEWACWDFHSGLLNLSEGVLEFSGLKIRLLDNGLWRENLYTEPADVVVLCRGFLGSIEELAEVYPTECLVLDASLYKRSRERILRECAAMGIEPVDISKEGAVKIVPQEGGFSLVPMRGK